MRRGGQLEDVVSLIEEGSEFRDWIAKQSPDARLLREYYSSLKRGTWIESLPARGVRFSAFSLAGAGLEILFSSGWGVSLGLALGFADEFLLEKLAAGWRPSQYVEQHLQPFVAGDLPPDYRPRELEIDGITRWEVSLDRQDSPENAVPA